MGNGEIEVEAISTRQLARKDRLAAAILPLDALESKLPDGDNRRLDESYVERALQSRDLRTSEHIGACECPVFCCHCCCAVDENRSYD